MEEMLEEMLELILASPLLQSMIASKNTQVIFEMLTAATTIVLVGS